MKTKIKYLLVLVLASFVFAGCTTTFNGNSEAKQWEYKIVRLADSDKPEVQLNKLSQEGWILVAVEPVSFQNQDSTPQSGYVYITNYIFKRSKQ